MGNAVWTLPAAQTVEPFGKITVRREADGSLRVRAYVLMEQTIEGARAGLAIDGSGTMAPWFGTQRRGAPNIVAPLARQMTAYLAQRASATGRVGVIYWATGGSSATGGGIEALGELTGDAWQAHEFAGPQQYGNHTHLLPAVRHFVEAEKQAWGLYVFITDGRLEDLDAVKAYTVNLARQIAARRRAGVKLVLVGVGRRVDQAQMQALDHLDSGTGLDLWDAKLAESMQHLAEIFAEVVDASAIIAPRGLVRDSQGRVVVDYRDTGVPAVLEFVLPNGATGFALEVGEQTVVQALVS